ncbi:hypothetical protein E2320_014248 [Naja naja]|nr:hypothetical protein E2320_014248 [Naja naja]
MKIFYLVLTFLFLAILPEPGNAIYLCYSRGGVCVNFYCPPERNLGTWGCNRGLTCCRR